MYHFGPNLRIHNNNNSREELLWIPICTIPSGHDLSAQKAHVILAKSRTVTRHPFSTYPPRFLHINHSQQSRDSAITRQALEVCVFRKRTLRVYRTSFALPHQICEYPVYHCFVYGVCIWYVTWFRMLLHVLSYIIFACFWAAIPSAKHRIANRIYTM